MDEATIVTMQEYYLEKWVQLENLLIEVTVFG